MLASLLQCFGEAEVKGTWDGILQVPRVWLLFLFALPKRLVFQNRALVWVLHFERLTHRCLSWAGLCSPARAVDEGKQRDRLLPNPKTGGRKHIFLLPRKSRQDPARGTFGKSPIFLESLRFSPGTLIWQCCVHKVAEHLIKQI